MAENDPSESSSDLERQKAAVRDVITHLRQWANVTKNEELIKNLGFFEQTLDRSTTTSFVRSVGKALTTLDVVPKQPDDGLGVLTRSEYEELAMMRDMFRLVGIQEPETDQRVAFFVEHRRTSFLLRHALEGFRTKNRALYIKISWLATGAVSSVTPETLSQSSLITTDGRRLRQRLITELKKAEGTEQLVRILEKLQELLPEVEGEIDF